MRGPATSAGGILRLVQSAWDMPVGTIVVKHTKGNDVVGLPWPSDPHLRRWMLFVDGENLTRRVEEIAASGCLKLVSGSFYQPGDFVWLPGTGATEALTNKGNAPIMVQPHAIRSHYYTSVVGDDPKRGATREALWNLGFYPEVFRREKSTGRSKGVDIALARDLLANSFRNNLGLCLTGLCV